MHFTWKMKARYLFRDSFVWDSMMRMRNKKLRESWEKGGRCGPPHIIKQQMILDFAKAFHTDTLIETGTYLGDMIYAMKDQFKDIYSIELSEELHNRAKAAFKAYHHIHLIAGDSAVALENVLTGITGRCLFWLDGHYSAGITALGNVRSPVRAELDAILRHSIRDHVILIDDAACFDGNDGYPTLFELHDSVVERFPDHELQVFDNVIQIRPKKRNHP
jgi:hypothetical protein